MGLYYLNSRYYDSNIGRFISPDRIDVLATTPDQLTDKNLYAYCDNNPITRADGDGEYWHIIAGAVIGGVISGVSAILTQYIGLENGEELNWGQVIASTILGMTAGALAASGAPAPVVVAFNAVVGGIESVYSDLMDNKSTNEVITNALISAGTSVLFSFIGGPSDPLTDMYFASAKASKQILAGGIAPTLKKEALKTIKTYYKSLGRFIISEARDGLLITTICWGTTEIIKQTNSRAFVGW